LIDHDVNILLFNRIFILWKKGEATPATEYHHKRLSSSQLESPLQKVLARKEKRNMKAHVKKDKERLVDIQIFWRKWNQLNNYIIHILTQSFSV
jgi:hypothetical protein